MLIMTAFLNQCSQKCHISQCSDISRRESLLPQVLQHLTGLPGATLGVPSTTSLSKQDGAVREKLLVASPYNHFPCEMVTALQAPKQVDLCKNITKPIAMSQSLRSKGCLRPFSLAHFSGPEKSLTLGR